MARRVTKSQAPTFFVDVDCHPQTIAVIRTRAEAVGWTVIVGDPVTELDPTSVFGALLQYPGSSGAVRDHRDSSVGCMPRERWPLLRPIRWRSRC